MHEIAGRLDADLTSDLRCPGPPNGVEAGGVTDDDRGQVAWLAWLEGGKGIVHRCRSSSGGNGGAVFEIVVRRFGEIKQIEGKRAYRAARSRHKDVVGCPCLDLEVKSREPAAPRPEVISNEREV